MMTSVADMHIRMDYINWNCLYLHCNLVYQLVEPSILLLHDERITILSYKTCLSVVITINEVRNNTYITHTHTHTHILWVHVRVCMGEGLSIKPTFHYFNFTKTSGIVPCLRSNYSVTLAWHAGQALENKARPPRKIHVLRLAAYNSASNRGDGIRPCKCKLRQPVRELVSEIRAPLQASDVCSPHQYAAVSRYPSPTAKSTNPSISWN